MKKNILNLFSSLDKLTKLIMKNGLHFCFVICLVSLLVLITYNFVFTTPVLFSLGILCLKLSFIFGVEFIICGIIADKINKQLI